MNAITINKFNAIERYATSAILRSKDKKEHKITLNYFIRPSASSATLTLPSHFQFNYPKDAIEPDGTICYAVGGIYDILDIIANEQRLEFMNYITNNINLNKKDSK